MRDIESLFPSLPVIAMTGSGCFFCIVFFPLEIFLSMVFLFLVEKRLVDEVRHNDTLIIVGETGSGKTTRMFYHILLLCLEFYGDQFSYLIFTL